jgi:hypothetical protein
MALWQRIFRAARFESLFFLGGLAIASINFYLMMSYAPLPSDSPFETSFPSIAIYSVAYALGTGTAHWGFYKANT